MDVYIQVVQNYMYGMYGCIYTGGSKLYVWYVWMYIYRWFKIMYGIFGCIYTGGLKLYVWYVWMYIYMMLQYYKYKLNGKI